MTTEYYQVEEAANGGNFWTLRHDRLTLEKAMARAERMQGEVDR